jgi:hypothetical protein
VVGAVQIAAGDETAVPSPVPAVPAARAVTLAPGRPAARTRKARRVTAPDPLDAW